MKNIDFTWLRPAAEKFVPLLKKYRPVLIVLLAGILLLASGGWFKDAGQKNAGQTHSAEPASGTFDLAAFRVDLTDQLSSIEGVGRVSLMLSLEETEEAVYAVNVRQSQNSGSGQSYESNLTVLSDGSYGENPVTVKSLLPTFRGAVVLCDGADNAKVRLAVTQAVSTVCGMGADKVTVLKMATIS